MHVLKPLLVAIALTLATAACDGPVGPQGDSGPQGEQGPQGPGGPQGAPGEDGQDGPDGRDGQDGQDGQDGDNANVTLYVFDGHDFNDQTFVQLCTPSANEQEHDQSAWLHYLIDEIPGVVPNQYYSIPGFAANDETFFDVLVDFDANACPGDSRHFISQSAFDQRLAFDRIHVIQIEASNVEDCTGGGCLRAATAPELPVDLDISDYDAVVDHYGLTEADAVRL